MRALTSGNAFSASTAALTKKRHEAELHAVLLLELLLVLRPQVHDGGHVGFVERRQRGGRVLAFEQPLGDPLADPAHRLAGFALAGLSRGRGRAGFRRRLISPDLRLMSNHIILRHASARPRRGDRLGIEIRIGDHRPGGGRKGWIGEIVPRRSGQCAAVGLGSRLGEEQPEPASRLACPSDRSSPPSRRL